MNKTIAKQQRVENILLTLRKCDYLTRSQIQTIHKLGGDRNANRILKDMEMFLGSFRHELEKVYYLNKAGREQIMSQEELEKIPARKKTPHIQHYLMRNQLWIAMGMPHSWENEIKVTVGDISIVCDAKFSLEKIDMLVEVDVAQSMAKNRGKIEKYKRIKELTGNDFHLIWVTETESRRVALKKLMAAANIPGMVHAFKDIK